MKFVTGYGLKQISQTNHTLKTVASYNVFSIVVMCSVC